MAIFRRCGSTRAALLLKSDRQKRHEEYENKHEHMYRVRYVTSETKGEGYGADRPTGPPGRLPTRIDR